MEAEAPISSGLDVVLARVVDAVSRCRSVPDGSDEHGRETAFLIVDPILWMPELRLFPKRLTRLGMSKKMSADVSEVHSEE